MTRRTTILCADLARWIDPSGAIPRCRWHAETSNDIIPCVITLFFLWTVFLSLILLTKNRLRFSTTTY